MKSKPTLGFRALGRRLTYARPRARLFAAATPAPWQRPRFHLGEGEARPTPLAHLAYSRFALNTLDLINSFSIKILISYLLIPPLCFCTCLCLCLGVCLSSSLFPLSSSCFSSTHPFPFPFHHSSSPLLFFLLFPTLPFPFAFSLAVSPRVSPSLTGDRSAPPLTLRHPSHTSEASLTWLEKWSRGDGQKLQSVCRPPLTFRYYQDVLHNNRCPVPTPLCLAVILIPFSLSTSKIFSYFSLSHPP